MGFILDTGTNSWKGLGYGSIICGSMARLTCRPGARLDDICGPCVVVGDAKLDDGVTCTACIETMV